MNNYFYSDYRHAAYYDDIYDAIVDDLDFWKSVVSRLGDECLELACGTGRVSFFLHRNGIKVTGIDFSEDMLQIFDRKKESLGIERNHYPKASLGDMRCFNLGRKFRSIIIPSNSLNHIEENNDLIATFRCISDHLEPEGLLAFDILNPGFEFFMRDPASVYDQQIIERHTSSGYFETWEMSRHVKAEQMSYVKYYFRPCRADGSPLTETIDETDIKVRFYYPKEIELYLDQCGFEIVSRSDWYDSRPWKGETSEQVFIVRKK